MNTPKYTMLKSLSLLSFIFFSFLSLGQWAELQTGLGLDRGIKIDCSDANNCIVGGAELGKIYKTNDGGQNWTDISLFYPSGIYLLQMLSPNTIYAAVGIRLMKTVDGGATWTFIGDDLYRWHFITPDIGYSARADGIAQTTDGGITWTNVNLTDLSGVYINRVYFLDINTGFASGVKNGIRRIYKTINGGVYWDEVYESPSALFDIQMVNFQVGYACGWDGLIVKTTDGGNTWNELSHPAPGKDFWSLDFINTNSGYVVGDSTILKTTDGGNTWISESQNAFTTMGEVKIADLQTVYIAPNDGDKILKNSQANLVIGLIENAEIIGKVYPNPVRDYLNIELEKTGCSFEVFDQSGKLVTKSTLKDYNVTQLDLSKVKSGLYIYRIQDENGGMLFGRFTKL